MNTEETLWNQKEGWYERLGDHEYVVTKTKHTKIEGRLALKLPQFEMRSKESGVLVASYHRSGIQNRGQLCLFSDFKWDGPSGIAMDTESAMWPSGNHDAFFRVARIKRLGLKFKPPVDKLYRINLIKNGAFLPRCWWHWTAVRYSTAAKKAWTQEPYNWDKLYTVTLLDTHV